MKCINYNSTKQVQHVVQDVEHGWLRYSPAPPWFSEQPEGNLAAWHVHHKFIMRGVKQTECAFMQRWQQLTRWPPPPAVGEESALVLTTSEKATALVSLNVSRWESGCR